MACLRPGDKSLSEPILVSLLMYTVYPKKYAHGFRFAVLCCGYTLTDFPISIRLTSLALWQFNDCRGNLTIAPVPAKQPSWIWINTSCEFIMNDCISTTKQSTTKPCAYFLGYTVYASLGLNEIMLCKLPSLVGSRPLRKLPLTYLQQDLTKLVPDPYASYRWLTSSKIRRSGMW